MENKIELYRHSLAHIMASAVLKLYPKSKFGVGPTIENGFYYDIELDSSISESDLSKIEDEMKTIISSNIEFVKSETKLKDAIKLFTKSKQDYKVELLKDLEKKGTTKIDDAEIFDSVENATIYTTGEFVDLCRGPHIENTSELRNIAFKLTKLAGAYWRGNEKNKMLTRIYGIAFETQTELDEYLKLLEEAEKRDHRKLGKELDLFVFSELVGAGLPLYTPKGVIIIDELKNHIESVCRKYGFQKVSAPSLAKIELFEISGHAKKFGAELFHVSSEKNHDFVLKPVQCPHHTQIYASKMRSYKDLPIRYMESDKQYRAEKTGEVGGLSRVYAITIEDGHSFCRKDQVKQETENMVNIIKDFYSALGLWGNHWISLSVRDYAHPEKYIGTPEDWDTCEEMLKQVSDEMNLNAKRCEGEAALYGPKLDFMFKDALGKEIQIPTVQLDFATPKRFNLTYINEKGEEVNPVMVHRAVLGSYERFLALLLEHYGGAFPLWLSPVQVKIISVGESHIEHCKKLANEFRENEIRVDIDDSSETVGNKIRKSSHEKVPYVLVIGDKEINSPKLSVRVRGEKDLVEIEKDEFIKNIQKKIANKDLGL